MSFVSSIIVVEEIARSRKLYEDILKLKVTADFGIYNVGFEGGLSLYRKAFFRRFPFRSVQDIQQLLLRLLLPLLRQIGDEHHDVLQLSAEHDAGPPRR